MMGLKDIELVLVSAVGKLVPTSLVYVDGDYPAGKITQERVVIIVKDASKGPIFNRGFVEVNFCVPDIEGRADHQRLQELESQAVNYFWDDVVGDYGDTVYRYGLYSHGIHEDKDLGCHFANIRLLFETLNVR